MEQQANRLKYILGGALAVLLLGLAAFAAQGYFSGAFSSEAQFRGYMSGFGVFAPAALTMIQAIQEETIRRIILARVQTNEVRRERVAKVTGESGGSEEPQKKAPVRKSIKIGPNDPCPCGSGKKYKKCCYLKDKAAQ